MYIWYFINVSYLYYLFITVAINVFITEAIETREKLVYVFNKIEDGKWFYDVEDSRRIIKKQTILVTDKRCIG